jgi:hypothetical protein
VGENPSLAVKGLDGEADSTFASLELSGEESRGRPVQLADNPFDQGRFAAPGRPDYQNVSSWHLRSPWDRIQLYRAELTFTRRIFLLLLAAT